MRLICPDCGAQYEIAAEMIPPEGRDVQCSNCATTWFQMPPAPESDAAEAPEGAADTLDAQEQDDADLGDGEAIDPDFVAAGTAPRRGPDARTLEILRQEREFNRRAAEAAARGAPPPEMDAGPEEAPEPEEAAPDAAPAAEAAEAQDAAPEADAPPEVEPEDDTPEARARRERDRMAAAAALARARDKAAEASADADVGASPATTPPTATPPAPPAARTEPTPPPAQKARVSRAGRLPEIGEVDDDAAAPDPEPEDDAVAPRKRGFRTGFAVALLVLALATLVYVYGPRLGTAVPGLADGLRDYRTWVDGRRAAFAQAVDGLTERMQIER
ncbi:zinc-ribbon domain-containing protein [Jannaschia sp. Os4]|uniref:zinc-ribbon domain-containing protein n=1 Tax=Jannaschia sp. Os4 TaxID=2807617 RepID=UPI001939669B|nr:zinc-ribbon domain-containing protein [Jannaschia sp. Os4]MBM2577441.1 zinc-ribbon domain-containing protein [Jannaschia sp. Os4]